MRGTMKLALLAGTSLACSSASAQYLMNNSTPGTFTDISGTGTAIALTGDDNVAAFTSSVTNSLVTSASMFVCTNGFISNSATYNAFTETALPQASVSFGLFPYWDDLFVSTTATPVGSVVQKATTEGGVPVHIVEWVNNRLYPGTSAPASFEVKIWGAGGPALVQYLYGPDMSFGGATGNGASASVGVQWTTTNAVQYSLDTAGSVPNNAVISVVPDSATGACCTGGTCTTVSGAACVSGGGTFLGSAVTCAAGTCVGRCCNTDGTCSVGTQAACTAAGGVFAGTNTDCTAFTCPQPGACCKSGGVCSVAPQAVCVNGGGVYGGDGSTCAAASCNPQYFYDDGVSENNIGFASTAASIAWLNQYAVVNSRSVVNSIDVAFGLNTGSQSLNGAPVTVYLWSDPNGDGSPTDAVVLASASGVVTNSGTDTFNAFPITPTNVGPNGTKFFVGAIVNGVVVTAAGIYPCRIDQTHTQGKSWISGNATTVPIDPANLAASGTGVAVIDSFGAALAGNWMIRADAGTAGSACYANCDNSTQLPFLNVQDFSCFLTKYAAGNSYANCDNSTQIPVLNVQDFSCFLTKYAAGCSAP